MNDDRICPWDILGVSPWDDADTIHQAWRALVRQYHPDLAKTDPAGANRRLAEINAAFEAVSDPLAARLKIEQIREAQAARRAAAARRDTNRYAAQQARSRRRSTETPQPQSATDQVPTSAYHFFSAADLLRAQATHEAFLRTLRILNGRPATRKAAHYL